MGWLLRWLDRMLGSDIPVIPTIADEKWSTSPKSKSPASVYRFQPAERPRGPRTETDDDAIDDAT